MKKKLLLIINPRAGAGCSATTYIQQFKQHIDSNSFDFTVSVTSYPGHAYELSKQAIADKYSIIAVTGGDGSIHEAGKAIINTNAALAVIPCGSGNGFARNLRIPLNLKKAVEVINMQKIKIIDTVNINNQFFLNAAGAGFDAYIAGLFNKSVSRGFFSYFKITLKEFFSYQPKYYTINADGKTNQYKALLMCFANSSQYGYNAIICPGSDNADKMFDICIIEPFPKIKTIQILRKLFAGTINDSHYYKRIIVREAIIHCEKNELVHLDGEVTNSENVIHLKVNPASLKVIVP